MRDCSRDLGEEQALLGNQPRHPALAAITRQGLKVACIEEIAYGKGFINESQLLKLADRYGPSQYGTYLRDVRGHKRLLF